MKSSIEGEITKNHSVVVVEDLVSTGKSSLKVVDTLRTQGVIVKGMICVFNYGFEIAKENFRQAACPLYSLSSYDILIRKAIESRYVSETQIDSLNSWRENPETWGK